jgi:hypothetical protein
VYDTVIPRNVRLSECPSFGRPVLLYDVQSVGAKSYLKLAKELIERQGAHAEGKDRTASLVDAGRRAAEGRWPAK